ncbi:SET domain-containing protein [Kerstersia similis]
MSSKPRSPAKDKRLDTPAAVRTAGRTGNEAPAWHRLADSPVHGKGVFAARDIPAGTRILEYQGERIDQDEADRRHPVNPDDPFHTFFFALSSGIVIDGGVGGNDSRWINHACAPNCETQEGRHGKRVYIVTLRDIRAGEELNYDYGLVIEGRQTRKLKEQYHCLCGAANCRGTMLAPPQRKRSKKVDGKPAAPTA